MKQETAPKPTPTERKLADMYRSYRKMSDGPMKEYAADVIRQMEERAAEERRLTDLPVPSAFLPLKKRG